MRAKKEGFTLAELLIVVAIILVLVAIAIPVFTGALASAEKAVDEANMRSVKSEAVLEYTIKGFPKVKEELYYYVKENGDLVKVATKKDIPAGSKYRYMAFYDEPTNTVIVQKIRF